MKYDLNFGKYASMQFQEKNFINSLKKMGWKLSSKAKGTNIYVKQFGKYELIVEVDKKGSKEAVKKLYAQLPAKEKVLPEHIKQKVLMEIGIVSVGLMKHYAKKKAKLLLKGKEVAKKTSLFTKLFKK